MTKAAIGPSKSKSDQNIELSSQLVAWAEGGRLKASPLARRLAQEAGLELSGIRGSGPGGRIVKGDVEEASHQGQIRKTIVRHLAESL